MLSMSLKPLSIILMRIDGKKQPFEKKYKRKYSNTKNKKMSRESKIHFFSTDDAVASFTGSPIQMQMSIWRSELGVDSFEITNARNHCWVLSKN